MKLDELFALVLIVFLFAAFFMSAGVLVGGMFSFYGCSAFGLFC